MQPSREPRPGHRILESGIETYDIAAHIERAFEDLQPGDELNVVEIMHRGRRDGIPESRHLGTGAIAARLTHSSPSGIRFKYNKQGALVGFKVSNGRRTGTNMVHYKTKLSDGPFVSIQAPDHPVRILAVHIERNLDDGVDVTVEWEDDK